MYNGAHPGYDMWCVKCYSKYVCFDNTWYYVFIILMKFLEGLMFYITRDGDLIF